MFNKRQSRLLEHVALLHAFYGEQQGLRIARKHVGWYLADDPQAGEFLRGFNRIDAGATQLGALRDYVGSRRQPEVLAA